LDSQRFLPNPFADSADARLCKTGDRGRFLPDGNIEYLGRSISLVTIRGFQVELAEVRAAIHSHPNVQDCIVLAKPSPDESPETLTETQYLVGYVVLKRPDSISAQALKTYLRGRLPDHALPRDILILASFPLTSAGKINVVALRNLETSSYGSRKYDVHRRELWELRMTRVWRRLLRISPVGGSPR
jgi:acyl-CoA synthetase (AMP-forming)/AMP-acid ligase II